MFRKTRDEYLRHDDGLNTSFLVAVYLLTGLVMMMVVLSVLYDIPELNLGFHFYLKSDPVDDERTRLKSLANMQGPGLKYTKQVNEAEGQPSGQENFRPGAGTYQSFQDKDIGEE